MRGVGAVILGKNIPSSEFGYGIPRWRLRTGPAGSARCSLLLPLYHNDLELEFALASYLLIVHNQDRVVFQPMPVRPVKRPMPV